MNDEYTPLNYFCKTNAKLSENCLLFPCHPEFDRGISPINNLYPIIYIFLVKQLFFNLFLRHVFGQKGGFYFAYHRLVAAQVKIATKEIFFVNKHVITPSSPFSGPARIATQSVAGGPRIRGLGKC